MVAQSHLEGLDVCFAKKRGLKETDMCRSEYVYHRLRCFRAGIESGISWLKQCMGLTCCTWKGWEAFESYAWSSIVANEPAGDLSAISETLGFR